MKVHPVFSKSFLLWWFILALVIALKIILIGLNPNGISNTETYQNQGVIFWILGILFSSIVFSAPFNLIYRIISKKWNNKIFMILISVFVGLHLILI
jgi:hypothetical protein